MRDQQARDEIAALNRRLDGLTMEFDEHSRKRHFVSSINASVDLVVAIEMLLEYFDLEFQERVLRLSKKEDK